MARPARPGSPRQPWVARQQLLDRHNPADRLVPRVPPAPAASKLSSMRARQRLEPLATALEGCSGADARQLARMAWQVATTHV